MSESPEISPEPAGALHTESHDPAVPVTLIVKDGDQYRTVAFDYHDGLRYPRLERIVGTPDRLGDILTPRAR